MTCIKKQLMLAMVVISLFSISSVYSGVNEKNGNYYTTFTDVEMPQQESAPAIEISRTYNSSARSDGLFGYGWGSNLETYVYETGKGSLVVHENGSGAITRYISASFDEAVLHAFVEKLLGLEEKSGSIVGDKSLAEHRAMLLKNAEKRESVAAKYYKRGLIKRSANAPGTVFHALDASKHGPVEKTKSGYLRTKGDTTQYFNSQGRLIKVAVDHFGSYSIAYDDGGNIKRLIDGESRQLDFSVDEHGHIVSIGGDVEASYKYKDQNLVESVDMEGGKYGYSYDEKHQLTEIKYTDGSSWQMSYAGGAVTRVIDRHGERTDYSYGYLETDKKGVSKSYFTNTTRYQMNEKGEYEKQREKYVMYEISIDENGVPWTTHKMTRLNGRETAVDFHRCGTPRRIIRGDAEVLFEHSANCDLIAKETSAYSVKLVRDPDNGKVTRISETVKATKKISWTSYEYNDSGDLIHAKNSEGDEVRIVHNDLGLISEMIDPVSKTSLLFAYNKARKPVKIELQNVGVIAVEYSSDGEIDKVDSDGGHEVSLRVTEEYQRLLKLMKSPHIGYTL